MVLIIVEPHKEKYKNLCVTSMWVGVGLLRESVTGGYETKFTSAQPDERMTLKDL